MDWFYRIVLALVLLCVTAFCAFVFTTIAGSLGGELSPFGESVMDPVYKTLGINVRALTLTQNDVYVTAGLMATVVVVAGILSVRWKIAE